MSQTATNEPKVRANELSDLFLDLIQKDNELKKLIEARRDRLIQQRNAITEEITKYNALLSGKKELASGDRRVSKAQFETVGRGQPQKLRFKTNSTPHWCVLSLQAVGQPMYLDDMLAKSKELGNQTTQALQTLRCGFRKTIADRSGIIIHLGNDWYGLVGRDTPESFERQMAAGELKRGSEQPIAATEMPPPEAPQASQVNQPTDPTPAVADSQVSQPQLYPDI